MEEKTFRIHAISVRTTAQSVFCELAQLCNETRNKRHPSNVWCHKEMIWKRFRIWNSFFISVKAEFTVNLQKNLTSTHWETTNSSSTVSGKSDSCCELSWEAGNVLTELKWCHYFIDFKLTKSLKETAQIVQDQQTPFVSNIYFPSPEMKTTSNFEMCFTFIKKTKCLICKKKIKKWYIHNAFNQKGTKDTWAVPASCWLYNNVEKQDVDRLEKMWRKSKQKHD